MASVFPDNGKRFAPVALAGEEPVAEFVINRAAAQGVFFQPGDHLFLRFGCGQSVEKTGVHREAFAGEAGRGICILLMRFFHSAPFQITETSLRRIGENVPNLSVEFLRITDDMIEGLPLPKITGSLEHLVGFIGREGFP